MIYIDIPIKTMYNIFIFNKTETRLKTKRNSSKKMTHKTSQGNHFFHNTIGDFRRKADYKHEKKNDIWSHWCRSKRLSSA